MSQQYERTMICKNCNEDEIGKDPNDGKWYTVKSGILHTKVCKNPQQFKRRSTYPQKEQVNDALVSEIKDLKERVTRLEEVAKAHTLQLDFKKGSELG